MRERCGKGGRGTVREGGVYCIMSACWLTFIAHMHAERYEELKGEVSKLEQQRDQALSDFESLEKSFADLHQRYLKLKSASQTLLKVGNCYSYLIYHEVDCVSMIHAHRMKPS